MPTPWTSLPPELSWHLIDRYYAGDGTEAERAIVRAYLAAHPDDARIIEQFVGRVKAPLGHHPMALDDMWDDVQARIGHRPGDSEEGNSVHRTRVPAVPRPVVAQGIAARYRGLSQRSPGGQTPRVGYRFAKYALLPLVVVCLVLVGVYHSMIPGLAGMHVGALFSDHPVSVRQFATANGQRASIELSDGTQILLGVDSRLVIPSDFGQHNRTLTLVGEALFTVARDAGKPFVVHTDGSAARVLGTSFTVRHYKTDASTQVTVLTGKVAVGPSVLTAGEQGIQQRDGTVAVRHVAPGRATAWISGQIAFDHVPLREVIAELNRWYDVKFVLDDPTLGNEPVTVNLKNRSAEEVATVLDEILKTTHRRNATAILFTR